jgi:hypothetical protein
MKRKCSQCRREFEAQYREQSFCSKDCESAWFGNEGECEMARTSVADISAVMRLRNYYRKNFTHGHSDDLFIVWLQQVLDVASANDRKADKLIDRQQTSEIF